VDPEGGAGGEEGDAGGGPAPGVAERGQGAREGGSPGAPVALYGEEESFVEGQEPLERALPYLAGSSVEGDGTGLDLRDLLLCHPLPRWRSLVSSARLTGDGSVTIPSGSAA
jgi:hypothetical protein